MECPKCQGLMIPDRLTDYSLVFYAWRCINCGIILDETILKNRQAPPEPARTGRPRFTRVG